MDRLWERMGGLFGTRWTSQHALSDTTGEWGSTLAGVRPDQIKIGLDRLRLSGAEWPPSAPEFRHLCVSEGVTYAPDFDVAYSEIVGYLQRSETRRNTGQLSDPVYHTITNNLDYFSFKQLSGKESMQVFRAAYNATLSQLKNGLVIQRAVPRHLRIAEESQGPIASVETVEKGLANLKSLLGDA